MRLSRAYLRVDWHRAACEGVGWDPFFGGDEGEAKALCQGCPIQRDCLRYAVNAHEVGVWGGMTDEERRAMVRRIRRRARGCREVR